jgi:integrase
MYWRNGRQTQLAGKSKRTAYYLIKTPFIGSGSRQGKRASFALQQRRNGKTHTVEDERIDAINRRWSARETTFEVCLAQIEEIKKEYEAQAEIEPAVNIHNADNMRIFQTIWEDDYQYRDIVSAQSRMREFANVLELLGHRSLLSISLPDFQNLINEACADNPSRQRRWVDVGNQLLKFAFSRGLVAPTAKLKKKKKQRKTVSHLSMEEWTEVKALIEDGWLKLLYEAAMTTGGRLGELLGLSTEKVKETRGGLGEAIFDKQLVKQEKEHTSSRAPERYSSEIKEKHGLKNQTERRTALVLPEGLSSVQQWATCPKETRVQIRTGSYNKQLTDACKKVFPNDTSKHLTVHDLRHSYAIHLLRLGMSMEDVARSIGDTLEVCQEHYAGFAHTPETIESMADRFLSKTNSQPKAP